MRIRKKTLILTLSYITTAIVALAAYTCVQSAKCDNYRRTAEYGYENAFSEVVLAVTKLDGSLKKAAYATGAELSMELCGEIYSNCLAAEMTMAALPFSSYELERTASFIGVCGDYAASLLRTVAADGFGETERANMSALSEISDGLAKELSSLRASVNDGDVVMDAPEELIHRESDELLSVRMKAYEETFSRLPELDYEGLYTDPSMTAPDSIVSEAIARAEAERFTGEKKLQLEFMSEDGSRCFSFDGGTVTVNAEGKTLSLSSERSVAGDMDDDELTEAATAALDAVGLGGMRLSETYRVGSVLTASFIPVTDDGVLLYDAKVSVSVAADDGALYAFNAVAYYENVGISCDLNATVSREEAARALPSTVTVVDCSLELCTERGVRRLCYDFTVTTPSDTTLHILVDAHSATQFTIRLA